MQNHITFTNEDRKENTPELVEKTETIWEEDKPKVDPYIIPGTNEKIDLTAPVTTDEKIKADKELKSQKERDKVYSKGEQNEKRKAWSQLPIDEQEKKFSEYRNFLNDADVTLYAKHLAQYKEEQKNKNGSKVFKPKTVITYEPKNETETKPNETETNETTGNGDNNGGGEEKDEKLKKTLGDFRRYLHSGIIRDYKNGLFGDISTPEGRKDAKALATYYIVNRVGTFLANLSNGYFGRPAVESAYKEVLDEQEKALNKLGVERYGEQVKREIAKDWNVSDEEREEIIKGTTLKQMFKDLDINNQTVTSRWLSDKNLLSFGAKVSEMDNAELKKAILSNEQLTSIIENLDEATRKLGVDKNRVEQEIISQIIKNKHLDTKELLENINLGADVGGKTLGAVFNLATSSIK